MFEWLLLAALDLTTEVEPTSLLPGDPRAAQPALAARGDRVLLSWIEPVEGGHRLQHAQWQADGLAAVETVASGEDWFVNWADFPTALLLDEPRRAGFVLRKRPGSPYAYGVQMLLRDQDGWRPAAAVHDDSATEHGFVALWDWQGAVGVAWLDGRDSDSAGGHDHHGGGAMALRAARIGADGRLNADWVLDQRNCDCCRTDAAMTRRGPVLVYRDRSEEEIRDIAIVRWVDGQWTAPRIVHQDGWVMPGCPVNGPAVAALGDEVVVVWPTGAGDAARILLARSDDGGAQFAAPIEVAQGESALGRVDLALSAAGEAWISWVEERAGDQTLMLSRQLRGGPSRAEPIAAIGRGRGTGVPQLALTPTHLHLVWTDTRAGEPRVRGLRRSLDAASPAR